MDFTSIFYDTKSQKVGILIPMSKQDLKEKTGVIRFFYSNEEMPANNWQTLDNNFSFIGECPTNEKFFVASVLELLSNSQLNKNLHIFWADMGIEL